MKIYKYASLSAAIAILQSGGVALSNPNSFNDPNDCSFDQDESEKKKIKKLIRDYAVYVTLCELVKNKSIKLNRFSQKIFEHIRYEINEFKSILSSSPYFDQIPGFEDLYKIVCSKSKKYKELLRKNKQKFINEIDNAVESAKKNALVSCFSKRNDSMLMWSHYASSHKGVCIEYDRPDSIDFRDVIYQNCRPTLKLYKMTAHSIALNIIGRKDTETELIKEFSDVLLPFFVKSKDWEYEKEVRCLFTKSKPNEKISYNGKRYILEMEYPTAIYVGCKATGEDLDHLIRLAKNREIPVYFMKISKNSFDIIIDNDYKYVPGERKPHKDVTLLRLVNEINRSLDNKSYLAAFALSLIIPGICSQVEENSVKDERERYIAWCNDYLYCTDRGPDSSGIAYLSGEILWKMKEQLFSCGNIEIQGKYEDFDLRQITLSTEEKNDMDIYFDLLDEHNIILNVTKFSSNMIYQANRCYKKNRLEIEALDQLSIQDFESELEELRECAIISKRAKRKIKDS